MKKDMGFQVDSRGRGLNVVVTGASRGLGRTMAEKFAENGYNLYLTALNEITLYKTMEEMMTAFPDIIIQAKPFDLSKKQQAIAFANWVLHFDMTTDVLINNAGTFLPGSVHNEQDGVLETTMETNLYSAYHITRTILPSILQQGRGHIFNICSIASLQAYRNGGAYSISKFALSGFSRNLREEMKPYGIKVTAVYPGAAWTDSWAQSGLDANRFMEAGDIADMVFAASQLSPQACVEDIVLRPQSGDV
jgi:short-subunit dehydrogenase